MVAANGKLFIFERENWLYQNSEIASQKSPSYIFEFFQGV
jgi:hypothetical protein